MKNEILYADGCLIYPGVYVPVMNEDELKEEIKQSFDVESVLPPVNIVELADSYIVELTLPGISREDFLIHADNNVLSVCVLHQDSSLKTKGKTEQHGFKYGLFDRHIQLPAHADAAFISAEYTAGTLLFHIPKTSQPVKNLHSRIVVY